MADRSGQNKKGKSSNARGRGNAAREEAAGGPPQEAEEFLAPLMAAIAQIRAAMAIMEGAPPQSAQNGYKILILLACFMIHNWFSTCIGPQLRPTSILHQSLSKMAQSIT